MLLPRPGLRPMRALRVLEPHRTSLEKCVFCPKLCRSACPVSNAEPRETITPWGKMSVAWMAAHGDVPLDASHAAPPWACTGCFACRESCDHRNEVADVLLVARDGLANHAVLPAGARRVIDAWSHHDRRTRRAAGDLARRTATRPDAGDALVVGCGYLRAAPREAQQAVGAAVAILGEPVALLEMCCGLPLRLAGDLRAFVRQAEQVARALHGRSRVIVADAGCALALVRRYPEVGVRLPCPVEPLVELAAASLSSFEPSADENGRVGGAVRWHDPCQLGRGLGIYDAPRAVLEHALGRPPDEFDECRERAVCSGAGGLVPATLPHVARNMARSRLEAHVREGGGRLVTACAASLVALRRRAPQYGVQVEDLIGWIGRITGGARRDGRKR